MISKTILGATLAVMASVCSTHVSAASVDCGGTGAQLRIVTVDPALTGGLCATQEGNFNPAAGASVISTATGLTAVFLDKDQAADTDVTNEAWLTGFTSGATSGSWTVSDAAWNVYQRLFLGFHFGDNNGAGDSANPDSFFVELARTDNAGTWTLHGTDAVLNDISHIDLFGAGSCTASPGACGGGGGSGGGNAPEPGSLALVGLALLGAGIARKRLA